jgi:Domain of unknown function (DUF397)
VGQRVDGFIGVRDSKSVAMPALGFTPAGWQTFVGAIKRDLPGRR